jgi:hypothetical protein
MHRALRKDKLFEEEYAHRDRRTLTNVNLKIGRGRVPSPRGVIRFCCGRDYGSLDRAD